MRRWPLRWQLALLTSALVALVLGAVGVAACLHLYNQGVDDLDRELHHVAHEFFLGLGTRTEIDWANRTTTHDLLPAAHYLYLAEVVDAHGGLLYRSRELGGASLPKLPSHRRFATLQFRGHLMRVGSFEERAGIQLRLAMALHTVEQARDDLLSSFLVATPLVILVVGAGGWLIARRALAPIQRIASSAERISAKRLDQRLPAPRTGDEIERLTVVLNHMFDRLEASFLQATRFTADASHELKTPLTVIRGELEAAVGSGQFEPAQEKLLLNLMEETERLTQITDGLLLLSRADAGRLTLELKPVDLRPLLDELLEDAEILAGPSGIQVEADLLADIVVLGVPQFLRQILLNLLDNAIKYNEPGGRVKISAADEGGFFRILFGNTGPGIKLENAEHVFGRFFRGDESRSRSRSGHGLGLSICREIVRAHGGEIMVTKTAPGWTELCFSLMKAEKTGALG